VNKKVIIIVGIIVFLITLSFLFSPRPQANRVEEKGSDDSVNVLYQEARDLETKKEWLQAKDAYKNIIRNHFDFDKIEETQKRLEALNINIILSNLETPQSIIHVVEKGDSLSKIGQKYNVTMALIKKSNNLKDDVIRIGQRLRIWQEPFSVFVDKSQNKMILRSGDEVVKVYTVATGANNSTPVGNFVIDTKLVDPVWFKSGAVIPAGSPQNELGARWMGFDMAGYGIHGTIDPGSLGQQATAGCIRMSNEDVIELYDLLPMGTQVTVVD
jgi:lipoprotein-anchoring transpeptidase ErfK/SrfK